MTLATLEVADYDVIDIDFDDVVFLKRKEDEEEEWVRTPARAVAGRKLIRVPIMQSNQEKLN